MIVAIVVGRVIQTVTVKTYEMQRGTSLAFQGHTHTHTHTHTTVDIYTNTCLCVEAGQSPVSSNSLIFPGS